MGRPNGLREIKQVGSLAFVTLTKGYEAVIDLADWTLVSGYNWSAFINSSGQIYAIRQQVIDGKQQAIFMHQAILGHKLVDHVDGNGLNNRRLNLRSATKAQNGANTKLSSANKSGVKGVRFNKAKAKWGAQITFQRKQIHIGYFQTAEEAISARQAKELELQGEYRRT